ncbi:PIN-like domain-containing protein, partial [Mesorhizobium sp. GbtcB19]
RYSPDTSNHILKVLNSIPKHQLWIPAQVLEEYKQNHDNVRNLARNKYKEVTSEINRIISNAENSFFKQFTRFNKLSFPKVQELSKDTNQAITRMKAASKKYAEEIKHEIEK